MAKRPCARAGCPRLVERGYCADHQALSPGKLDDKRRGSSASRGYGYRWQRYRAGYLAAHPLCADPDGNHPGLIKLATDVDHKVAVSGPDDPLFWEPDNHQPLCHECHSGKTAREDGGFGRVRG